jgi:hypothetical protein
MQAFHRKLRPAAGLWRSAYLYQSSNNIYITCRETFNPRKVIPRRTKLQNLRPQEQKFDFNELVSIEDIIAKIDTTLTPEQQAHVDKLKRKMKGKARLPSSFRDVPGVNQITGFNGFLPNVPANAEKIIDWALAHIPVKGGARRTREKKRVALREAIRRANHAKRKAGQKAAHAKKLVSFHYSILIHFSPLIFRKDSVESVRK